MSSPLLIFLLVTLVALSALAFREGMRSRGRAVRQRFAEVVVRTRLLQGKPLRESAGSEAFAHPIVQWAIQHLPASQTANSEGQKVRILLSRAGIHANSAMLALGVIRIAAPVLGAAAGATLMALIGSAGAGLMFGALIGFAAGTFVPMRYIAGKARKRQRQIGRELSDTLDLLVVCVEAGLGLNEAIKIVGVESERQGAAIGRELTQVSAEISAGASLGQALRALSERTTVEEIKPLATALIQSEQLGSQIAPLLRAASDTLRMRRRLSAEEAAQKTTIKILFPLVLFILPAMLIIILGPAMIQIFQTLSHR